MRFCWQAAARRVVMFGMAMGLGSASPAAGAASPELDLARKLNEAFVQVADTVSPAVVVVRVWQKPDPLRGTELGGLFRFLPEEMQREMERELREREGAAGEEPGDRGEERDQDGGRERPRLPRQLEPDQGSGVIIRENGYILTNSHVVENAERIEVRLRDGRRFDAVLKGTDSESDLAVIQVSASGLPAAKLGDSQKVRVGEFAIAIGAPFDLEYSVTFGHVSAKGRRVLSDIVMMDQDFIQTDASINPGNSGGPLVNIDGEVIGINAMIRGMNTGIGFAVPVNLAREVADGLIEHGRFRRAWLGVNIETVRDWAERHPGQALSEQAGVVVTRILPEGPSAGTELKAGDIIVGIDGAEVRDVGDLKRQVSRKPVGKSMSVEVRREGERKTIALAPGELPENRMTARGTPPPRRSQPSRDPEPRAPEIRPTGGLGLEVKELDAENAGRLRLDQGEGVLVVGVEENSPAAARRIRVGEVITKVNRKSVRSPKEFEAVLKDADLSRVLSVTVVSESGRRVEVLRRPSEP